RDDRSSGRSGAGSLGCLWQGNRRPAVSPQPARWLVLSDKVAARPRGRGQIDREVGMSENWHRRHALGLACQLPDNAADANAVIRELQHLDSASLADPPGDRITLAAC